MVVDTKSLWLGTNLTFDDVDKLVVVSHVLALPVPGMSPRVATGGALARAPGLPVRPLVGGASDGCNTGSVHVLFVIRIDKKKNFFSYFYIHTVALAVLWNSVKFNTIKI